MSLRQQSLKTLKEILFQRGKIIHSIEAPQRSTFLKYTEGNHGRHNEIFNLFSDRTNRNSLLYNIYNGKDITLPSGKVIAANENLRHVYSKTFEWYVSSLLLREFRFVASGFGIKLKGAPDGGDYDVIAASHTGLIYIECKSGKPRGIDEAQIHQFVKRHYFLRADYSILYIDYKGLDGNFPFTYLSRALNHNGVPEQIYKIESTEETTSANFYAARSANIYVVDTFNSTGNVINNLRFTIDSHFAFKTAQAERHNIREDLLRDRFQLTMAPVLED